MYVSLMNLVIIAFLALVWSTSSWLNYLIKFGLICATAVNTVVLLKTLGYIVQV